MPPSAPTLPFAPMMNPWEINALRHQSKMSRTSDASAGYVTHDPLIYPGLYSPSGFDMMSILLQIISRPNPIIELGPIDCSVAMVLCDLSTTDYPIVYCSDSFCEMSGYKRNEVLGRGFNFLQAPPLTFKARSTKVPDKVAVHRMRQALQYHKEIQLPILNFKQNGQSFNNIISIIPVGNGASGYRYAVGLQAEAE